MKIHESDASMWTFSDVKIIEELSGIGEISERQRYRYEFNPAFRETLEKGGLIFSRARSAHCFERRFYEVATPSEQLTSLW